MPSRRRACFRVTPELRDTYKSYMSMTRRCSAKSGHAAKHYSERGVRVCAAWLGSFDQFVADVGPRPSREYSIDRFPDPTGNYEPGNCRWATMPEQQRNRRNCLKIAFCGEMMTASEIAEVTGLSRGVLFHRILKANGRTRKYYPRKPKSGSAQYASEIALTRDQSK